MAERELRFGVRDLFGLRGGAAWLFVLIFEATVVMYMRVNFELMPWWHALPALVLLAVATLAVLVVPAEPLPWPATVLVMCAAPVAAALTVPWVRGHSGFAQQLWTPYAASYVLAMLVLRGRAIPAWIGVVATATVIGTLGVFTGWPAGSLVRTLTPIATVAAVTVFTAILRPAQRTLRDLREQASRRAATEAALSAADTERGRQLARLDRVARPLLDRIAAGADLGPEGREQCRLLEAELRDSLRAPELATAALSGATRAARARGVEVTLLDDGGFAAVAPAVRDTVIRAAATELAAAAGGHVTVRVLPAGRRWVATVLATGPDGDRRTEIDTAGAVRMSS
ncbi:hypothetical protein [Nocardia thailandica]|uniref:Histidine kinase n=1 Tax=Nocardia thailandica TaxID=257275 RepID=A0ABW6PPZ7_9NOCA